MAPHLKGCFGAVAQVYGKPEEAVKRSRRGERNEARAMAMYVCRKIAGLKEEEIAKVFQLSSYSAVSSAIGRTELELKRGGEIVVRFERIHNLLQR